MAHFLNLYLAVKVGRSPDSLLQVCSLIVLREVFIPPERTKVRSEDARLENIPEVDVIIGAVTELALVSATTAAPEEHLEPMFLQVVIEVSPPEI